MLSERLARGVDQATQRTVNRDINNLSQNTQQRVAEQGSTDLNRLVAAQQDVFERDFAKAEADRINAEAGLAVTSVAQSASLANQSAAFAARSQSQFASINQTLQVTLDREVKRGIASFNQGAANKVFTGINAGQRLNDLNVIENAEFVKRDIAEFNKNAKKEAINIGLAASLFIPGFGLAVSGARLGIAGLRLLAQGTATSTLTGATSLVAGEQLIENGLRSFNGGAEFISDGGLPDFEFSGGVRGGAFISATAFARNVEAKILGGSNLPGTSLSLKSKNLEAKDILAPNALNTSVRLDFDGNGLDSVNPIAEIDSQKLPGSSKRFENKIVTRQNLRTGQTSIGTNSKLTVVDFPVRIFGNKIFDVSIGGVFETRIPVIPIKHGQ